MFLEDFAKFYFWGVFFALVMVVCGLLIFWAILAIKKWAEKKKAQEWNDRNSMLNALEQKKLFEAWEILEDAGIIKVSQGSSAQNCSIEIPLPLGDFSNPKTLGKALGSAFRYAAEGLGWEEDGIKAHLHSLTCQILFDPNRDYFLEGFKGQLEGTDFFHLLTNLIPRIDDLKKGVAELQKEDRLSRIIHKGLEASSRFMSKARK